MTGWILSFLPVVLGIGMYLMNPERHECPVDAPDWPQDAVRRRRHGHRRRADHHGKSSDSRLKGRLMGLALFAFIAAFLLISSLGILIFYRQTALRRLSQVVSHRRTPRLLAQHRARRGRQNRKTRQAVSKRSAAKQGGYLDPAEAADRAGYREKPLSTFSTARRCWFPARSACLPRSPVYASIPFFVYAMAADSVSVAGFLAEQSHYRTAD